MNLLDYVKVIAAAAVVGFVALRAIEAFAFKSLFGHWPWESER